LIVRDPVNDPHLDEFDEDRVLDGGPGAESMIMFLGDWHHEKSKPLVNAYISPENRNRQEPKPDSAFVNGRGRCKLDCPLNVPRYVTTVRSGRRYLLHFINSSGMLPFTVSIDGHPMTILYVDGVPHQPLTVSRFDVYPAQRYTVVITANQTIGNYWIRTEAGRVGVPGAVLENPNFDPDIRAILRYEGAPEVDPTSLVTDEFGDLEIRDLSAFALTDPRLQGDTPPDVVFELKFREDRNENGSGEWQINEIAVSHNRHAGRPGVLLADHR
jgi:iron transport multicopper oxidase